MKAKILNFSKWCPITAINGGYKPPWIAGQTNGTGNYAKHIVIKKENPNATNYKL